ncbi:tetratricopeptide repeat-containing sulfotransferase family protein [Rubinisphaera italica]|nr:tetratricopeptide repeat-containing sulfotransferase family protein [Rubinisphaera italica]
MTLESPVSAFSDVHFTSSKIMPTNKQTLQLFQAGRLQEAEVLIQKMIASNQFDAEGWHLAAVIALQQKNYSEAGLRIEQCLQRDNAKAEFWNTRGAVLLELREFERSFESFAKAVELRPDYVEAWRNRGLPLQRSGHREAAQNVYREATIKFPRDSESWSLLADSLLESRQISDACEAAEELVALQPNSLRGHLLLIRSYLTGEFFEAVEYAITLARQQCDDDPRLDELEAIVQLKLENYPAAIEVFERVVQFQPHNDACQINLAIAYLRSGRRDKFEELFSVILGQQQSHPNLLHRLGLELIDQTDWKNAIRLYEPLAVQFPENPALQFGLIKTLMGLNQINQAENLLGKISPSHHHVTDFRLLQAHIARSQNQSDHAIRALRHLLAEDPNHIEGCRLLAEELLKSSAVVGAVAGLGSPRRQRLEEALLVCQRGLSYKDDEELLYLQAKALHAIQRPLEAIVILNQLAETTTEAKVLHLLGQCQLDLGTIEESRESFQKALQSDPNYVPAHYHLAFSGEFADVDQRILEVQNRLNDGQLSIRHQSLLWMALGRAYDAKKLYAEAFDAYLRGNQLKPRPDFTTNERHNVADHQHFMSEIAAVFDCDFFNQRSEMGHSSELPVFIVGMPRTGTTLTEQILSSHSHVYAAGELQEVGAWPIQIECMICTRPLKYPSAARELNQKQVRHLASRHARFLTGHDPTALRIVDKMPTNFLHLGMIGLLFPNARIIHCIRDPRDVAISCIRQNLDWPFCDLEQLGPYITAYQNLMKHWEATIPNPIYPLSYETLVTNPDQEIRRLIEFCNLPWQDQCLSFDESERAVITPSKTQVRKPMYQSSIGAWKRYETQLLNYDLPVPGN